MNFFKRHFSGLSVIESSLLSFILGAALLLVSGFVPIQSTSEKLKIDNARSNLHSLEQAQTQTASLEVSAPISDVSQEGFSLHSTPPLISEGLPPLSLQVPPPLEKCRTLGVIEWVSAPSMGRESLGSKKPMAMAPGGTLTVLEDPATRRLYMRVQCEHPPVDVVFPAFVDRGNLGWGPDLKGGPFYNFLVLEGQKLVGLTVTSNGEAAFWSPTLVSGRLPEGMELLGKGEISDLLSFFDLEGKEK